VEVKIVNRQLITMLETVLESIVTDDPGPAGPDAEIDARTAISDMGSEEVQMGPIQTTKGIDI